MIFQPTSESCLTLDWLEELMVESRTFGAEELVGAVFDKLQECADGFFGIVYRGGYVGLISKAQIAMLLSGRFGYALYAKHTIREHLLLDTVVVRPGEPLLAVLDRALSRTGQPFHDDLAVVDSSGGFLGVLPMPTLLRLQNELIAEQTRRSEENRHALESRELQLFRSQERLRQSEGRFGILFEHSPLGFALLTTDGRVEAHNRRFAEMLGVARQGALPVLSEFLRPQDQAGLAAILRGFETNLEGEPPSTREWRLESLGNEPRLVRCDFHWIQETGQVCLCVQDVTAQRRLEQRLQQKEKSVLLDTLAGGIAHELNNKLLPVLGYAEMLQLRARDNMELSGWCDVIRQSTVEAAELTGQLLQLSRPPALEPRACDLVAIVHAAMNMLRFRLRELSCEPVLDLPARLVPLHADPAQLKQVIVNLCFNAIDAMSGGDRPRLHLSLLDEDDGVCLRVQDAGSGIPEECLPRIFDPFFTTKGVQQGTGLGLSVCFSIIQQHGGTIEVESTGPEGTTFAIWLPLAAESLADAGEASAETPVASVDRESVVLVVDDEPFITSLVHETLRSHLECRVVRAGSTEEALQFLETMSFQLIISDVRLPGRNGLSLFEECRERWPQLAAHFFFITGDAGSRELNTSLERTGCPVLRKPFSIDALAAQAAALLPKEASSVALA
ncbi:PAS/PAC sensor hybrid histidine kinase [Chthoniobacter flavus Ellin428]|uniref:histidine kinase n=1 Tax=Chthoniobacter flavus Ellin428 TaxID=497964 RepID=B4D4R9_9BACT|nr:PAS domain-containing sensor histidine kinase [Chthoniobacter flavus]EDY18522.1 PAS/PAC sensor hybrid histidine kinase [Chthoniobacter flavus Ellin428]TCO91019.1 PAS domain-containing protein [Chthoniobacter flavus]